MTKHSTSLVHRVFAGIALLFSVTSMPSHAENPTELQQLLQLAEYIGVDYTEAVANGEVVNTDEYAEMQEFSALIVTQAMSVDGANSEAIQQIAQSLAENIQNKGDALTVQAATNELRRLLLAISPQLALPTQLLPQEDTRAIFEQSCASCHGMTGRGDGSLANNLVPEPTDFTDHDRAMNRSILGLFDTITNGINNTAMPSFNQLTDEQRWSLAFFAASLAFSDTHEPDRTPEVYLEDWISFSPKALLLKRSELTEQKIAQLRVQPDIFFTSNSEKPLTIARHRLEAAVTAYHAGEFKEAQKLAISAYLDGFELVENSLDAKDVALRREIETSLLGFRQVIAKPDNSVAIDRALQSVLEQLDRAEQNLAGDSLSSTTLFSVSFVIMLREGLEALLVIVALATVLVRTQRKDALIYVHIGWGVALVAGMATWLVAQTLINISGASREIMEGFAALLAALVLFYVGFWMHSKTNAAQWQAYINRSIQRNLKTGTLWGIAGLSFIAVYREVFETVLFYESLLTQAVSSQYAIVIGGFLAGSAVLAVIAWLMIRYSVRLPIARFFSTTTYLLLALSFVLMGKAVAALQEAAIIGITRLPTRIEFDWLGIHSTWEGILTQLTILTVSTLMILKMRFHSTTKITTTDVPAKH